ncbi:M23 family metallopeptidase [Sedimentitalea sp. JM2-8]|uniref:M23 family metallopeptidase n=1 Tax=Sedimentitalea xiamensis TaxID=3050037 RepID=A0ABT7FAC1_9RHOB|nr:M23 family metallopeptidase [Sedimentitalea xiamensis]MDK3071915.1 M23 family metallopeptidase [Sedimentitalea xiamensis]
MRPFLICALLALPACSEGPYRLPYADGTEVLITNDETTHSTPDAPMFDMRASFANEPLVAAKAGWVRYFRDTGDSSAPNDRNNYVWIEHPLDYCQASGSVPPGGQSGCRACARGAGRCNEWSLYAHMAQNSVSGTAGLSTGDWVDAGQQIGIEGDVGFTPCAAGDTTPLCGRHVHFSVFRPDPDNPVLIPDGRGTYEAYAEANGRPERIPLFCTSAGLRRAVQGSVHVAAACP